MNTGFSLVDLLRTQEREGMGIGEARLGVTLSFTRGRNGETIFGEVPFMTENTVEIGKRLLPRGGARLLSSGRTEVFVGVKGEKEILVNGKRCDNDPFGRKVLDTHLTMNFDIMGRACQLQRELEEMKRIPMTVHTSACTSLVRRYLKRARGEGLSVTTGQDVQFVLRPREDKREVTSPPSNGAPYVVTPIPLQRNVQDYTFYWTWVKVFMAGYRILVNNCFYEVARGELGADATIVPLLLGEHFAHAEE